MEKDKMICRECENAPRCFVSYEAMLDSRLTNCPSFTPKEDGEVAKEDAVNHPSHYTTGKIEVIDFIEDQKLPYHLGNVVKYIARAGKKDPAKLIEDLKKADWYLDRYISLLEGEKNE